MDTYFTKFAVNENLNKSSWETAVSPKEEQMDNTTETAPVPANPSGDTLNGDSAVKCSIELPPKDTT